MIESCSLPSMTANIHDLNTIVDALKYLANQGDYQSTSVRVKFGTISKYNTVEQALEAALDLDRKLDRTKPSEMLSTGSQGITLEVVDHSYVRGYRNLEIEIYPSKTTLMAYGSNGSGGAWPGQALQKMREIVNPYLNRPNKALLAGSYAGMVACAGSGVASLFLAPVALPFLVIMGGALMATAVVNGPKKSKISLLAPPQRRDDFELNVVR